GWVSRPYAFSRTRPAAANVGLPLEARAWPRRRAAERVDEMLELVGLAATAGRYPHQLSGGQQQRVALARALAGRPQVLLLDEPLSALDALTRTQLRDEIRRIQLKVGMTALYVTHDQAEALAVADRVGVMAHGRLVELGPPAEIYLRPTRRFTASFLGGRTMLRLAVGDDGTVRWGEAFALAAPWPPGTSVIVGLSPEAVRLDGERGGEGRVVLVSFRGATIRLQIAAALGEVAADVASTGAGRYSSGDPVRISVAATQLQMFRADEESGSDDDGA